MLLIAFSAWNREKCNCTVHCVLIASSERVNVKLNEKSWEISAEIFLVGITAWCNFINQEVSSYFY